MKKWRIAYWLGLWRTEWIVRADTKDEAIKKFEEEKGNGCDIGCGIISINEVNQDEHN